MRLLSKIFASAALASSLAAAGCGGSSDSPPGPLARHFDDMYIAQVPMDKRTEIVNSQQAWSVAKMENAKAEADFADSTTQLTVARNELKSLRIGVDTAITQKKSAASSGDTNKINAAAKDQNAAESLEKAGVAHVKYLESYRAFLQANVRYTQENMYWLEAKFELSKSTLAQRSNIAPQKIKFEWFPGQEQERGKRVVGSKQKSDARKSDALKARETWMGLQKTADTMSGKATIAPDPMAPAAPVLPPPAAPAPAPAPAAAPAQ